MKNKHRQSTITALVFAALLGIAGFADAQPGQYGMSPEQYKAMQDSFSEFDKKIQPLRQQLYDKQAELDALYSSGTPNDARAQALMKDIDGLDVKLQEARLEMRKQMAGKGIPFHGGRMGPGYGGPGYGGGYGPGCGGPGYGGGYCGGPGYGRGHGWHGGGYGWRGGWHGGGRMGRGGGCW